MSRAAHFGEPIEPAIDRGLDRVLDGLLALVAALGLVLHLPAVTGEFDRGFDGFQGAFFAGAAVNFQQLGTSPTRGYPLAQIDPSDDPSTWNVYTNHPRFVPHVALASLRLFGPKGWDTRPGPVPPGTEAVIRAPFFALQVGGWLLLAAAVWRTAGRRAALVALALCAHLPLGAALSGLVNYEHPAVFFVCAGALLATFTRAARTQSAGPAGARERRFAVAAGAACGLGAAVTYAPVLFVPAIAYACARGTRWRALLAGGAAAALALSPHVLASGEVRALVGARSPSIVERLRELLAPMWNGELPPSRWLAAQLQALDWSFTPWVAAVAALGLLLAFARSAGVRRATASAVDTTCGLDQLARLAVGLGLAALAVQVLFWRHTGDPQVSFLLNAGPAVVLAATFALERLARRTEHAHVARPAVLVALLLVAASSARARDHLQALRAPGPRDVPGATGPTAPLPRSVARDVDALLPPDVVVWYPAGLGFTPAVSFYAWRTFLPFVPGHYEATIAKQAELGLAQRPTWICVPIEPDSPAIAADVEALERDLESFAGEPSTWTSGRIYRVTAGP